ncbi:hypothetical protein AVEN_59503-1 [Araneus ventricosus]|uniref:Uncharacterized protein n=1 Tax=Araneus ventricosus TaxID=182803 RepID=A0A4Y2SR02_ARAVE|nr:hypothetical protein AVEN_59503-1 [Araneus ventricosus]
MAAYFSDESVKLQRPGVWVGTKLGGEKDFAKRILAVIWLFLNLMHSGLGAISDESRPHHLGVCPSLGTGEGSRFKWRPGWWGSASSPVRSAPSRFAKRSDGRGPVIDRMECIMTRVMKSEAKAKTRWRSRIDEYGRIDPRCQILMHQVIDETGILSLMTKTTSPNSMPSQRNDAFGLSCRFNAYQVTDKLNSAIDDEDDISPNSPMPSQRKDTLDSLDDLMRPGVTGKT